MKRLMISLLMVVGFMLTTHGANVLTITGDAGHPGDEVTLSVALDSNDDVTAVDVLLPLDKELTYVDGSCVLNTARSNGHTLTAAMTSAGLRVVILSLDLNSLNGNSGELFTFRLKLRKEPQTYELSGKAVLSDESARQYECDVESGYVTILSPKLHIITPSIDYGHIPIRSTYTKNMVLQNVGNETLQVSDVVFSAPEFSVDESAFSIEPGTSRNVIVTYAPVNRGAISEKVTFISNAINGNQSAVLVADPFSVNELHVGSASGISDEEVTISLTMNNMEPIVGVQCDIILPEELIYVEGSMTTTDRSRQHTATGHVSGNKLSLYLYSLNGEVIEGNDGEVATFRLKLNGRSSTYRLNPTHVLLSNVSAENMTSATSSGKVQIKSPSLRCSDQLTLDGAITETIKEKFAISNRGQVALTVNKITFLAEGYRVADELPLVVEPNKSTVITVEYTPTHSGVHSTTMQVYTNDPDNRMKSVTIGGSIYEPNNISLDGVYTDKGYDLKVSLDNYTPVVALQMDIRWLPGMNVAADGLRATDRLNGLSTSVTEVADGVYRVIIFSLNNVPISGNEGEIFTLSYTNDDASTLYNTTVSVGRMVFSSLDSENMSSQSEYTYKVPACLAQKIVLDKTSMTLKANQNMILVATIQPDYTTLKDVVWSSSDESVATVENGVVTAHKVGSATITATTTDGSNLSASCEVTVEPTPAESIALDKTEVTLKATETTTLTVTILPETTTIKDVVWSSSDESVATVENGVVTAHKVGTAIITATTTDGSNLSASCSVEVVATPAESIALDKTEVTLKATETTTLTVTILPETTTIKDVVWSSSDESVATVENGVVTAHKVGTATITATTTDGSNLSASCEVTVEPTLAESIALDKTEVTLKATETTTLTVTILPETATNKDVEWKSSDESVATVENGVVTAHQVGTATITVSTTDGTNLSASCSVEVVATPAESIALDRTEVTLKANETTTLTATILPETTTIKDVEWKSSDESVATVENGVVIAHQVGTATITATTTDGSNLSASCEVNVEPTPAESIALDKTEVTLKATETTTLKVTILPETTTIKDVEWKSSDESVATVENGVVTAHKVGTATITATTTDGSNLSASCEVTVEPTPAESIALDKTEVTLKATETTTLTATILPETTTIKDVEWKSSDESVATVENGVVIAHQVGTATITATTTDGRNLSASCEVTVVATPAESIALDKTEVTLKATETTTLTVTILPETTTIKDVVWSSNDESVATVENGVVTAHKVGLATITATTTDGTNLSASCEVTVEPTLAEEILLEPYEIVAIVGDTIELTATIYPKTVTEKAVLWTVSDETVAHIELLSNLCARVVVLREGVATIEVSTIDGTGLTATCIVNIYSHVNKVITDSEEVEYYDLGGLRVAYPSKGIYIVRQGQNVKKVVLK